MFSLSIKISDMKAERRFDDFMFVIIKLNYMTELIIWKEKSVKIFEVLRSF